MWSTRSEDPGRMVIPYVTEQSPRGERTMDIYSRLLSDRIIFLGTPVNDQVANVIMAQLLHLDAEDPEQDINIYINSPGGSSEQHPRLHLETGRELVNRRGIGLAPTRLQLGDGVPRHTTPLSQLLLAQDSPPP